jgi:hypothetical protein
VIAIVGRALFWLLCAMTAPRPPVPDLPPIHLRSEPPIGQLDPEPVPLGQQMCSWCWKEPARGGSEFCGDRCQREWTTVKNAVIPLDPPPPTLPDGNTHREDHVTDQPPGTALLPTVLEHTRQDMARADLTALGCAAALIALGTMITQINGIPASALPWLAAACLPAAGVLAAACWAMWPRHINGTPAMPGSWVHARTIGSVDELIGSYLPWAVEEITAAQTKALAAVAHRKFTAVRIMLPLLGLTIVILLAALAAAIL